MTCQINTPVTFRLKVSYMGIVVERNKVYYHIGHAIRSYLHHSAKYQGVKDVQLHAYIGDNPIKLIDVKSLIQN